MKVKIILAALLLLLFSGCGYLESVVTGVEPTPSLLSGALYDSLSREYIQGAELTLEGMSVVKTQSGGGGVFIFSDVATGSKILRIRASGYVDKVMNIDLGKNGNKLDSLFLLRNNAPPRIERNVYPLTRINSPLAIRFLWSFSDPDLNTVSSMEAHKYRFYFGKTNPPPLIDSGTISMISIKVDSTIKDRVAYFSSGPNSLYKLDAGTMYYYRILMYDLIGDSSVYTTDSFYTHRPFTRNCPNDMALVEVNDKAFCMDKREFSNYRYGKFDTSFSLLEDAIPFSDYNSTPVLQIDPEKADSACMYEGKRLCKASEWKTAMSGYEGRLFPYGSTYESGKCNTNLPFKSYSFDMLTVWRD
ncbi:MAG: hypothetical protein JNL74_20520, partial [Fibrobacteres bacterium]|nr:hypothetical protein [Fibrobacterota bacterium]